MTIAKHIPLLQVLVPFLGALFAALTFNRTASWLIAAICSILGLVLAIYAMPFSQNGISYAFGDWQPPIGIEYKIDYLNQPIIVFISGVLVFFLIFGKELINLTVTPFIEKKRQHLFYSILLFAHSGYLGVVSTNDVFNLYVFIEISSLATYVLMSKGSDPRALIGAFDYLMLGTIGATLILIGVGFFLALTGSLNITDISNILIDLNGVHGSRMISTATAFFLCGAILKIAFFPMHFWMIRAYSAIPPIILTYLASISSIIGTYIIMRFMHFTIDGEKIHAALTLVLRPMSLITIILCTYFAFKAEDIKKIIIYSSASQIGYIFLLLTIWGARDLMMKLLVLDGINKIALFILIAHVQNKTNQLRLRKFKSINGTLFRILSSFVLLFSSGLPLSSMFFVKVQLFDLLLKDNLYIEFIVVLIGSVIALLYHFKLGKALFLSPKKNGTITINTNQYGLFSIVVIQILSLIFINQIFGCADYIRNILI
jgi:multicomponent Na+:H+ antiporter subunit D